MNEFLNKINNKEYISNKLYQEVLKTGQVQSAFDVDKYNEEKNEVIAQFKYINDFYLFYQNKLYGAENYKIFI